MKTPLKISVIVMVLGMCLGRFNLFAQVADQLTISGKVTSSEDGSSIPGE
ncbi:MAG: hypothetical protein WDZ72_07985 [Cyclobacteriaceae bacterium]